MKLTAVGGSGGEVSLAIMQDTPQGTKADLMGYKGNFLSLYQEDMFLGFEQDPRARYFLDVKFSNCTGDAELLVEVTSYRGTYSFTVMNPLVGAGEIIIPLKDMLWNVTGVSFDPFSGNFKALKDTPLGFRINEQYGYDQTEWSDYTWHFGDGNWTHDLRPTYSYATPGIYRVNLTVEFAGPGMIFYSESVIEVVESQPIPVIEAWQSVDVTLTVAGRKFNTIGIRIYEDGLLIHCADITRTAGQPDSITLELAKYLGRTYEIELVYEANHRGTNPVWLNFTSGDKTLTFFKEFNTKDGFSQVVPVPASYLDNAIAANPAFYFDASDSYDIDGEIVSYEWDFGDGTVAQGIAVQHTYSVPGEYTVALTVTDDDGIASVKTVTIVCAVPVTIQPYPTRVGPGV
jgi:hypothetical protein